MHSEGSRPKEAACRKRGNPRARKTQLYEKRFHFPPQQVFHQLCPTRERDWIEGWDCDLIYTSTGYIEADCIFTTPDTNTLGPGLWIVTRYLPNRILELVRVVESVMVIHLRVKLVKQTSDSCTAVWHLTFTALNAEGDAIVASLPDRSPEFERAIDGLDYFLETGALMRA